MPARPSPAPWTFPGGFPFFGFFPESKIYFIFFLETIIPGSLHLIYILSRKFSVTGKFTDFVVDISAYHITITVLDNLLDDIYYLRNHISCHRHTAELPH